MADTGTNTSGNVTATTEIMSGLRQLGKIFITIISRLFGLDYINKIVDFIRNLSKAVSFINNFMGDTVGRNDRNDGVTNQTMLEYVQNLIQSLRRFTNPVWTG